MSEVYGVDEGVDQPTQSNGQYIQSEMEKENVKKAEDDGVFGNRNGRLVSLALIHIWFFLLSIWRWTDVDDVSDNNKNFVLATYGFNASGGFLIFFGLLGLLTTQTLEYMDKIERIKVVDIGISVVMMLGVILYVIGGIFYANYTIHELKKLIDEEQSVGSVFFFESLLVACFSLVMAVDNITDWLSISQRIRLFLVMIPTLLYSGVVLFFTNAIVASDKDFDDIWKGDTRNAFGCAAVGWFFITVAGITYSLTEFVRVFCFFSASLIDSCQGFQSIIYHVSNAILIFGGFLVFAGAWAISDAITSTSTDNNIWAGESDDNFNAYYVGFGFYVLFLCIWIAMDIKWGKWILARFG